MEKEHEFTVAPFLSYEGQWPKINHKSVEAVEASNIDGCCFMEAVGFMELLVGRDSCSKGEIAF